MPTEIGTLNDLDLAGLEELNCAVSALHEAGQVLANLGHEPRFSLVPGQQMIITAGFAMPDIARTAGRAELDDFAALQQNFMLSRPPIDFEKGIDAPTTATFEFGPVDTPQSKRIDVRADYGQGMPGGMSAPFPSPVAPADVQAAVAEGLAEAAPIPAEPVDDPAPVVEFVDRSPKIAFTPREPDPAIFARMASATPAKAPAPWTAGENAKAIDIYARAILRGDLINVAQQLVATSLNRPLEGVRFRLRKVLNVQIETALSQLRAPVLAAIETAPVPGPVPALASPAAYPLIRPTLRRHLESLSRMTHGKRWTENDDLALLEAIEKGLKPSEIAVDLGLDTVKVKSRCEALCGSFTAAEVRQALQQIAA